MDIDAATRAGDLAAQHKRVSALLADIDMAIKESWPVSNVRVTAPAEGASRSAGTVIDLFPDGKGAKEIAALILQTTQARYQADLADLAQQLEAL